MIEWNTLFIDGEELDHQIEAMSRICAEMRPDFHQLLGIRNFLSELGKQKRNHTLRLIIEERKAKPDPIPPNV